MSRTPELNETVRRRRVSGAHQSRGTEHGKVIVKMTGQISSGGPNIAATIRRSSVDDGHSVLKVRERTSWAFHEAGTKFNPSPGAEVQEL